MPPSPPGLRWPCCTRYSTHRYSFRSWCEELWMGHHGPSAPWVVEADLGFLCSGSAAWTLMSVFAPHFVTFLTAASSLAEASRASFSGRVSPSFARAHLSASEKSSVVVSMERVLSFSRILRLRTLAWKEEITASSLT